MFSSSIHSSYTSFFSFILGFLPNTIKILCILFINCINKWINVVITFTQCYYLILQDNCLHTQPIPKKPEYAALCSHFLLDKLLLSSNFVSTISSSTFSFLESIVFSSVHSSYTSFFSFIFCFFFQTLFKFYICNLLTVQINKLMLPLPNSTEYLLVCVPSQSSCNYFPCNKRFLGSNFCHLQFLLQFFLFFSTFSFLVPYPFSSTSFFSFMFCFPRWTTYGHT